MTGTGWRTVGDVAWREMGRPEAPAIVACHGMALDHRDLADWLAPLAADWRIILWDMPGHGQSGPIPHPCTISAMTDALAAVMAAAAVVDPVLIGFSFGGMVAQDWLRRGGSARGLAAIACHAPFSVAPPVAHDRIRPDVTEPMAGLSWDVLRETFLMACSAETSVRDRLRPQVERVGREGVIAMTSALLEAFDPDPQWSPTLPLLYLRGDADANGAVLATAAAALTADRPDAREVGVAGAGHMLHMERAAETGAALAAFLAQVRPPT